MAQRSGRGKRNRDRGKRNFTEQEVREAPSKYPLRNTPSRSTNYEGYFEDPNPLYETGEFTRGRASKPSPKGTAKTWKTQNKNTHVVYFWRTESPFSQFHRAFFSVNRDNYSCAEQFMMSSKARIFEDNKSLISIMKIDIPAVMKKLGRGVQNFDQDIWKMCCRQYVQEGNIAKFSQNEHLLKTLLSTEDKYLAEASPSDRVWGIGMAESNPQSSNPSNWKGSNWLGEALNLVKFEFQMLIYLTLNTDSIPESQTADLLRLFQTGTNEHFDKMKCRIRISERDVPAYTVAGKKKYAPSKKSASKVEEEDKLAPNFDVQPPMKQETEAGEKQKARGDKNSDEKLESNEDTKLPKDSQEATPKHDTRAAGKEKSPLLKRKTSPNLEEGQASRGKSKIKKITFDKNPDTTMPASIRTAVEYILVDWARLRILYDISMLKCFMGLSFEDIQQLTGKCSYQTDKDVISSVIPISSVLIKLQKEFNSLQHIFANQTDLVKEFTCATNVPVLPTERPTPREKIKFPSFPKESKSTPEIADNPKEKDTPEKEDTATQIEPESSSTENTEISPNVQGTRDRPEDNILVKSTNESSESLSKEDGEISPNEPGKPSEDDTQVSATEQGETPVEKSETHKPEQSTIAGTGISPSELDKSTAEDSGVTAMEPETPTTDASPIPKESDKTPTEDSGVTAMELDKPTPEDANTVRTKETTEMEVIPTPPVEQDANGDNEVKRKSKKKKKSCEEKEDTDSVKRHKNNSEEAPKLVPYDSSSEQESPKEKDHKIPLKSENKLSSGEASPVMKSENKSDISLEPISLVQSGEVTGQPPQKEI